MSAASARGGPSPRKGTPSATNSQTSRQAGGGNSVEGGKPGAVADAARRPSRRWPYLILFPSMSVSNALARFLVIVAMVRHSGSCDVAASLGALMASGAVVALISTPIIGYLQDALPAKPLLLVLHAVQLALTSAVGASGTDGAALSPVLGGASAALLVSIGPHWSEVCRSAAQQAQLGVQTKSMRQDLGSSLSADEVASEMGYLSAINDGVSEVLQAGFLLAIAQLSADAMQSVLVVGTLGCTAVGFLACLVAIRDVDQPAATQGGPATQKAGGPSFLQTLWRIACNVEVVAATVGTILLVAFWMLLFFVMPTTVSPPEPGATLSDGCGGNLAVQLTTAAWGYAAFLPGSLWSVWLSKQPAERFTGLLFWVFLVFMTGTGAGGVASGYAALISVSSVTAYYLARYLQVLACSYVPAEQLGAHGVLYGFGMAAAQAAVGAVAPLPFNAQVATAVGIAALAGVCVAVLHVRRRSGGKEKQQ